MWWWQVYKCCAAGPWCNLHCETGKSGTTSDPALVKLVTCLPSIPGRPEWALWRSTQFWVPQCHTHFPWQVSHGMYLAALHGWTNSSSSSELTSAPPQMACCLTLQTSTKLKPICSQRSYRELTDEVRLLLHRKITQIFFKYFWSCLCCSRCSSGASSNWYQEKEETQHTSSLLNTVCSNYGALTAS